MDEFLNQVKARAAAIVQSHAQPRFALVTSFDPTNYTARVTLQPEGVLSGWLPVLSPWVGAGWGMVCPPSVGDQVMVLAQEGDAEHGVIIGAAYSNSQPAPTNNVSGEFWLVHASGSFLKLHNDGTIEGHATQWTLSGDLHVAGDVYDQAGSLSRLRGHYDAHTHSLAQGGATGNPDPQD